MDNATEILNLLAETATQLRRGQIDPRIAHAVGSLATVALKTLTRADLEAEEAKVEARKQEKPRNEWAVKMLNHMTRVSERWGIELPSEPEELFGSDSSTPKALGEKCSPISDVRPGLGLPLDKHLER